VHTLTLLAQSTPVTTLAGTLRGLISQAVTFLLSVVVGLAILFTLVKLLKAMAKDPNWEKLLGIVGVMILAVVLAGAAPGLLSQSYTWGKTLGANPAGALADTGASQG